MAMPKMQRLELAMYVCISCLTLGTVGMRGEWYLDIGWLAPVIPGVIVAVACHTCTARASTGWGFA